MRRFWRVFRWILLTVILLVLAVVYFITKSGIHTFDYRFAASLAVHADVYNSLGGNVERAIPDSLLIPLDETIAFLEKNKAELSDVPAYAVLLSDLYLLRGNDLGIRLRFREAIENYLKSEQQVQNMSSWYPFKAITSGNLHNLLHLVYDSSGELLKAEEQMNKSMVYFEATEDNRWIGLGRVNLARINTLRGDYDASIKNTDLSIAAYDEINKSHNDSTFLVSAYRRKASDYALLAAMAEKRGDQEVAIEYAVKAEQAGEIIIERKQWFNEEEQTYQWPLLLQDIALNWLNSPLRTRSDKIGEMLEEVERGLEKSVRPGLEPYLVTHKMIKGEWLLGANKINEASVFILEGLKMLGLTADENWVLSSEGKLRTQIITALMVYNRILPILLKDKGKQALLTAQRSVSEAIQQSGTQIFGDVSQVAQSNQERSIYTETIRTALELWESDLNNAVDNINFLAECQRAQILQKNLQRDDLINKLEGVEQVWLQQDEALKKELGGLYAALSRTTDNTEMIDIDLQINEIKQQRALLQKNPPEGVREGFFQLFTLPRIPSLASLQSAMKPNGALVQYIEMEQTLLVMTITKETVDIYETPPFVEWDEALDEFKEAFKENTGLETFKRSANKIYDVCLASAISSLPAGIEHLTFITDGPLRALNLEVCLMDDSEQADYQGFSYLLKDYSISYDYLLTTYFDHLFEEVAIKNQELVICAPPYITTPAYCEPINRIDSLYQFALELAERNPKAQSIASTKEKVRKECATAKNIFFAAHGVINEKNPTQSYLLLSPDENNRCRFFIGEFMNWRLEGANIIMGSCTTEAGKNVRGSGILSIAQAITVAGAKSLVANTGLVKDQQTTKLMRFYFEFLEKGYSRSTALRLAKLQYLDTVDKELTPPMNWAKTILIGHPG